MPPIFRWDKAMKLDRPENFLTDAPKTGILLRTELLFVDRNNRPHLLTSPRSMRVAGFVFRGAVSS